MKQTYDHPHDVLRFCASHPNATLVIVRDVTGGTLRARGALMAVTETHVAGYVSNGCVDADIIARARSGHFGSLVYGNGSPYRDITLPCGGTICVFLVPHPNSHAVERAVSDLDKRLASSLKLGSVSVDIKPRMCLRIAGRGAAFLALADMAATAGFEVRLQSPDPNISSHVKHLTDPLEVLASEDDRWTAVILLFHDHDWEPSILSQAIKGPAFYIGAMGSVKTHAVRVENLLEMGADSDQIRRVRGPIGLVPAQRDARSLAVSILAEIIQVAQAEGVM